MAEKTQIEWCDSTFNPWVGCTKISPACDHCYAEAQMDTRMGRVKWGAGQARLRTSTSYWKKPLRWNAERFVECPNCAWRGSAADFKRVDPSGFQHTMCPSCSGVDWVETRRRVFCASLADVFDNEIDEDWRADLLNLIFCTPYLDWLLLTKRIGNAYAMLEKAVADTSGGVYSWAHKLTRGAFDHVWLGATICNQAEADRDIPKLLASPAAKRFVSIEPMLGPVDLRMVEVPADQDQLRRPWDSEGSKFNALQRHDDDRFHQPPAALDWVICGGESGPGARPMHPDWVRSLRDQCAAASVPFLFKQWGEWGTGDCDDERTPIRDSAGLRPNGDAVFGYSPPFDSSEALRARGGVRLDGRTLMLKVGKKRGGRTLDGRKHLDWPA